MKGGKAIGTDDGAPRGRGATRPGQIPARGWKDILFRVYGQITEDNLSVVAAGVAFYALLALFPAIGALVSLYGLAFDAEDVRRQLAPLLVVLPNQAAQIMQEQIERFVGTASDTLGLAMATGLAISLWSATAGIKTLFVALNIVYDERESRGLIRLNLLALGMTVGAILFAATAFALVVAVPIVLNFVGMGGMAEFLISTLRWPVLALCVVAALTVLYRLGPDRENARWRWLSWGAAAATALWLVGSMLFSFYIANFANYDRLYGSLGAVIVLMLWIYLTAFLVLLGAELDSEIEHQTAVDSTTGEPKPMGQRGAHVADTLGTARK